MLGWLSQLSEKEDEVDRLVDLKQTNLDVSVTEEEISIHIIAFRDSHLKTYMLMVGFRSSSASCKMEEEEKCSGSGQEDLW